MHSLLIVDDDSHVLKSLTRLLRSKDYNIDCIESPLQALEHCRTREYDLVFSDQRMPGMTGTQFFTKLSRMYPQTRRILLSGYTDFGTVIEAFNSSIIHKFVIKPWDNEELKQLVSEQISLREGDKDSSVASSPSAVLRSVTKEDKTTTYHGLVTKNPVLLQQIEIISKTASSKAPFYINGETGTGKEMVARAIYLESDRRGGPFIAINCANLTETLLESQLFGHTKGAFTGADANQKGFLAEAEGGTLFLDEVTEIPYSIQAKLLRLLQEREYIPVGRTKSVPFDVRIISASSLSLEDAVKLGRFRDELRYRLEVIPIFLPPLRERGEDRKILFDHILANQVRRQGGEKLLVDPAVYDRIDRYPWPGNVREMLNVCTYIAVLASKDNARVSLQSLPPVLRAMAVADEVLAISVAHSEGPTVSFSTTQEQITRESLEHAIERFQGRRELIADYFGVSRMTLWRRMKKFGMDK